MSMTRHAVADWDQNPAPEAPTSPDSLKEAGLSPGFMNEMLLRTIYTRGSMLGRDWSMPTPNDVAVGSL